MRTRSFLTLAMLALTAVGSAQTQSTVVDPSKVEASPLEQWVRSVLKPVPVAKPKNEITPGYVLVKFRQDTASALATGRRNIAKPVALAGATFRNQIGKTGWTVWKIDKSLDPREYADQLMRSGEVVYAQPMNRIYPLLNVPNDGDWSYVESGEPMVPLGEDASFRRLWYLDDTFAFEAWEDFPNQWYSAATRPTDSPIIAVIDTGCDMTHPDFINSFGTGTDVAEGGQLIHALSQQFSFGEIVEDGTVMDFQGHGTHVAGLALAAGNNGSWNGKGMIGSGYPCRGVILRVFDETGYGSDADAAAAMFYAADNGVDIINLSLGTENYSQLFQDAVTYATQKGVLVVVASNEDGAGGGDLGPIYPAACSGALAVTANGPNMFHAGDYYAGTGMYLDVAAPGGNVVLDLSDAENPIAMYQYMYSTTATYDHAIMYAVQGGPPVGYELGYGYLPGTSMATPWVAGAAGLYYFKHNMRNGMGHDNWRTHRAIQRSAWGVYGAPKGSWEPNQGYGSLDMWSLLNDIDTRGATAGGIDGIVYLNGTATANVTVRARKLGSVTTFSTTTQADGTYRFDQLPEGVFEVWSAPGGNERRKLSYVVPGSDTTATDFWCGTYTGDSTPPVIRGSISATVGSGTNGEPQLELDQWAYDTETGIDRLRVRIGSKPGLGDLMPDTEIPIMGRHLSVPISRTAAYGRRFATLTYVNGAELSAATTIQIGQSESFAATPVSVSTPSSLALGQSFTAIVSVRNTGSKPWSASSYPKFALGSVNPSGTMRWGVNRVGLRVPVVRPGETAVFEFQCTAPSTPGSHSFQWQMMQGSTYFGTATANRTITVQ